MRIAVLASPTAWHFLDLKRSAGKVHDVFNIPFEHLASEIDSRFQSPLAPFQNRSAALPIIDADAVIVRTMPAGSLQQIIFRMDLLNRWSAAGLTIINPPRTIEISVDKFLSLAMFAESGIPIPATKVSQSLDVALEHFENFGRDAVIKPLFGSLGNGIVRIQNRTDAKKIFEERIGLGEVIYQQEFVQHEGFDIRVLVVGETLLAMKRINRNHWITNISKGAMGERHELTPREKEIAILAAKTVGACVAGVDLIYRKGTSDPVVVELNAVPGWQAISNVLNTDIAELVLTEVAREARLTTGHFSENNGFSDAPLS